MREVYCTSETTDIDYLLTLMLPLPFLVGGFREGLVLERDARVCFAGFVGIGIDRLGFAKGVLSGLVGEFGDKLGAFVEGLKGSMLGFVVETYGTA